VKCASPNQGKVCLQEFPLSSGANAVILSAAKDLCNLFAAPTLYVTNRPPRNNAGEALAQDEDRCPAVLKDVTNEPRDSMGNLGLEKREIWGTCTTLGWASRPDDLRANRQSLRMSDCDQATPR
jgi:hypothetical protein